MSLIILDLSANYSEMAVPKDPITRNYLDRNVYIGFTKKARK